MLVSGDCILQVHLELFVVVAGEKAVPNKFTTIVLIHWSGTLNTKIWRSSFEERLYEPKRIVYCCEIAILNWHTWTALRTPDPCSKWVSSSSIDRISGAAFLHYCKKTLLALLLLSHLLIMGQGLWIIIDILYHSQTFVGPMKAAKIATHSWLACRTRLFGSTNVGTIVAAMFFKSNSYEGNVSKANTTIFKTSSRTDARWNLETQNKNILVLYVSCFLADYYLVIS